MVSKNPRQNVNRTALKGDKKRPTWAKKEIVRLILAVLIFACCFIGKACIPSVQSQFTPMLQNLLSCSCDFEEAVRCFSTQLEDGNDVGDALEAFCATAFATQTSQKETAATADRTALVRTLAYPGTLADGF